MIYYRKKNGIKIAEIWFNHQECPIEKNDILRYKFVTEKRNACSFENLYTILLDLTADENELFAQINRTSKYQINRAKNKDMIHCSTFFYNNETDEKKILQYVHFFNTFADSKGRSNINIYDIEQFYTTGTFCVRCATLEDKSKYLTMHAYVISDGTARLHQSSSLFRSSEDTEYRNMIARANRLLHWDDILYFKNMGLKWYDFGGWYGGQTNKEQLSINQFKESFGGEKKQEYSYIVPVSFRGKQAVVFRRIIKIFEKIKWHIIGLKKR
jgi:lipid II:glycine glycyltransferase (peptidoglycan interpeptide bridge formation enzyme)